MKGRHPPDESPVAARSSAHPQPKIARAYVFAARDIDERAGLPGCVIAQYKRCGKPTCRCAGPAGRLHGPYFCHYWRAGGRVHKRYVPRADAPRVTALCDRYRARRVSQRATRRLVRDFAHLSDQLLAMLQEEQHA